MRVACFPLVSQEPWLDVVVVDGVNAFLEQANRKDCLAYPLEWSYDAIDFDSATTVSYLCDYGKRIGLDFLIAEQILSYGRTSCGVRFTVYDLEQGRSSLTVTDTLDFERPDLFFRSAGKPILEFASIEGDSFDWVSFPPMRVWKDYGWARYRQLRGELSLAEQAYRSGIAADSIQSFLLKGLASALLKRGLQLQAEGKFAEDVYLEAAGFIHRVLARDSCDAQAYRLLGELYVCRAFWNKAEMALKRAFDLDKNDPFLYLALTRLHSSRYGGFGFRNKKALLERALFLNPALEAAWIALGDDFYFRNKPDRAERTYRKLLRIHPRSLDGLLSLGKLYVFRNDVVNIVRVYEKVLGLAPDHADAYYNLGIAYYNDDKEEEAVRFFTEAVELDNHADSHLYLGVIYEERGDWQEAVEHYRERIRLRKGSDDPFAEEARKRLYRLVQGEDDKSS